jgi:hypothetical protein
MQIAIRRPPTSRRFPARGVENTDSEGKQKHAVNKMTVTINGRTGDLKALNSLIA